MPNWVINKVRAKNRADEEKLIRKLLKINDEGEYLTNFNGVIPMPEELRNSHAGYGDPEWEAEHARLLAKYGYKDWYDWSIAKWGTKWDGNDSDVNDGIIEFKTAWSAPFGVYREISKEIPIVVEYADEDIGSNFGVFEMHGGIERAIFVDGTDDQIANAIWGYGYDEGDEYDEGEYYSKSVQNRIDEIMNYDRKEEDHGEE